MRKMSSNESLSRAVDNGETVDPTGPGHGTAEGTRLWFDCRLIKIILLLATKFAFFIL